MGNSIKDIFTSNNIVLTICIIFGIVLIALLIAFIVVMVKLHKKANLNRVEGVKIIDNVRYTKNDKIADESGALKVSHIVGDILLERGKVHKASKDSKLLPGKYVILSANENVVVFNIRINGFVREVEHNTPIVITNGEEICATSHNVILR